MIQEFNLDDHEQMQAWDNYVEAHASGTPFHSSAWLRAIHDTYGFPPGLWVSLDGSGSIQALFPFFIIQTMLRRPHIVSIPFSDYGGPLCTDENAEKSMLSEIVRRYNRGCGYIELRAESGSHSDFVRHDYYRRHTLNLKTNLSELRKVIDKRTIQYSMHKAQRKGVVVVEDTSESAIREFYRLNLLTRTKHGVPGQPKAFFENLQRHVFHRGCGCLLLAFFEEKVIGASLLIHDNKTLFYKFSVSDPDYLKIVSPNHLLMWTAIEFGHKKELTTLDLGRTSPDNEGLMRFKKSWGTTDSSLVYSYYPRVRGAVSTEERGFMYKTATMMWRFLPKAVIEILGPRIYKHLT